MRFAHCLLGLCLGMILTIGTAGAASVADLDDSAPLVIVNGVPITKADHQSAVTALLRQLHSQGHKGDDLDGAAKSQLLRQLVRDELLYQECRKHPEIDPARRAEQLWQRYREGFADEEAYRLALARDGLEERELRDLLTRRAALALYIEEVIAPAVKVPEDRVRQTFAENAAQLRVPPQLRLSQVLLAVAAEASAEERAAARQRAETLRARALEGVDFAQLAREHSACPSRERGGDLGWLTREQVAAHFDPATTELLPGGIGPVVATPRGYHVVQVTETRDARPLTFEEVAPQLREQLQAQALQAAVAQRVALLQAAARIEVPAPRQP